MHVFKVAGLILAGLLVAPTQAFAANSVLSNIFDGSELRTDPLPGSCGGDRQLGYQDTGTFQVAASGEYLVADAFNLNGLDVTALVYSGAFDPANPENNLVTPNGIDTIDFVELVSGVTYRLVVQQWCSNLSEGAWAVTFSGPGSVSSDNFRTVPAMTEGLFTGSDPTASTDCGNSQYQQTGPMQVAASGRYYYTDILIEADVDACVQVYTAPFDPANPDANRVDANNGVGILDDFDTIDLEADTDYYFVVQPFGSSVAGEYFFVLAPPAPFRINKALAGAWVEEGLVTDGSGILIDVFDNKNLIFMAWFTYDLERPDPSYTAMIGEPGHRWFTAQGPYSGSSVDIPIYWNSGMVFDSPTPATERTQDGSLTIDFEACDRATLEYDLGASGKIGAVNLQTVADDHVELCEQINNVPGMPGLL